MALLRVMEYCDALSVSQTLSPVTKMSLLPALSTKLDVVARSQTLLSLPVQAMSWASRMPEIFR